MNLNKIKISMRSQHLLGRLKSKTSIPINVLARFSICLSFNDKSIPNPDIYPEDGMELLPHILFGRYSKMFEALTICRLVNDKLDPNTYLNDMLRAHLNRGSTLLHPRIDNIGDFYDLFSVKQK